MFKKGIVLCCMALVSWTATGETITTGTLIDEMVDMHQLVEFADPYAKTIQFSSYDRKSSLPNGKDWFANSDGFGGELIPNYEAVVTEPNERGVGEYLVCDVTGPGAIVRTWTALISGTLKLFLDDSDEPVYDGIASRFFLNPYLAIAGEKGISEDLMNKGFHQRNAGYGPIPFAKRCRIVWRGNLRDTHFYEVQLRTYDKDAEVQTFTKKDLKTYSKNIKRVASIMSEPDAKWDYQSKNKEQSFELTVAPNERKRAVQVGGPAAIEKLVLKIEADDIDLALRQTILHINFDKSPWAQVESPIGDFFGSAPGINPFTSVPFTVEPDGTMTCRYVMPFGDNANISIENMGAQTVTVRGEVLPADYNWNDSSMYFRARWRVNHDLVGNVSAVQDIPFIIANGTGRYVGTAAYILNPNNIPSIGGSWWGEGDEKIFVDDDIRPSTFGTGSEDYFNYAWSSNEIFEHPYGGQSRNDGPANRGFITNTRWHILDSLSFNYRLSFYMELYPHALNYEMAYARIGYHYGKPGMMDDHMVITREDVRKQLPPQNWTPLAIQGSSNSTFWDSEDQVVSAANGRVAPHEMAAGDGIYLWTPEKTGDTILFTIPIAEDGKYFVRLITLQDSESGKIAITLDGENAGFNKDKIVDLYRPHRTHLRSVQSKALDLSAGAHELTLTFKGGNKKIGIDFLWLQPR